MVCRVQSLITGDQAVPLPSAPFGGALAAPPAFKPQPVYLPGRSKEEGRSCASLGKNDGALRAWFPQQHKPLILEAPEGPLLSPPLRPSRKSGSSALPTSGTQCQNLVHTIFSLRMYLASLIPDMVCRRNPLIQLKHPTSIF